MKCHKFDTLTTDALLISPGQMRKQLLTFTSQTFGCSKNDYNFFFQSKPSYCTKNITCFHSNICYQSASHAEQSIWRETIYTFQDKYYVPLLCGWVAFVTEWWIWTCTKSHWLLSRTVQRSLEGLIRNIFCLPGLYFLSPMWRGNILLWGNPSIHHSKQISIYFCNCGKMK